MKKTYIAIIEPLTIDADSPEEAEEIAIDLISYNLFKIIITEKEE